MQGCLSSSGHLSECLFDRNFEAAVEAAAAVAAVGVVVAGVWMMMMENVWSLLLSGYCCRDSAERRRMRVKRRISTEFSSDSRVWMAARTRPWQ